MKTIAAFFVLFSSLQAVGCYTGARFNLVAPNLDYPVSMTEAVHDHELKVRSFDDYDELSRFTLTFTGWSVGFPLSPNPQKDISDRLNAIVKEKNGDGIVGLTITVGNNSINGVTMALKGISAVTFAASLLILSGNDQSDGLILAGASLACLLLLPTAGEFTISGTVVKFRNSVPGP